MILLINLIGIFLILFIITWFWLIKPKTKIMEETDTIDISVDNGVYNPANIKVAVGKKIKLRFFRTDSSPCSEWVVFSQLDRNEQLPLNQPHTIELQINAAGEYEFTCQMGMYRGKIIVIEQPA